MVIVFIIVLRIFFAHFNVQNIFYIKMICKVLFLSYRAAVAARPACTPMAAAAACRRARCISRVGPHAQ